MYYGELCCSDYFARYPFSGFLRLDCYRSRWKKREQVQLAVYDGIADVPTLDRNGAETDMDVQKRGSVSQKTETAMPEVTESRTGQNAANSWKTKLSKKENRILGSVVSCMGDGVLLLLCCQYVFYDPTAQKDKGIFADPE